MKKIVSTLKKIRKKIAKYLSSNRLFLLYVLFSIVMVTLLRKYTLGLNGDLRPLCADLGLILFFGSFGYFIKPKKQFRYYLILLIIFTIMCVVNSVYYLFYTSFASFSLLAELGLVGEVGDSLIEKFRFVDFIYLFFPAAFIFIHVKLKKGNYYILRNMVEKSKKMFLLTLILGFGFFGLTFLNFTSSDGSKIVKLWNRGSMVKRFGIVFYQGNDLVQSLTPKINSLFGYDEAAKEFRDFYSDLWKEEKKDNKYTNVLEGMNVIFIHMESIQQFLIGMEINGEELTPTINKLSKEGMYFSNFYPQVSVGTSSDTEFTINTSLMPASSGTVFVSYYNRDYLSTQKLLKDKGYYTFSSHANSATMWNRNNMHPSLGYEDMIFKDKFVVNSEDTVGLGLNDVSYFLQLQPMLEEIEQNHEHYAGTLIQLSNHSPYASTSTHPDTYNYFGQLNLTNTYNDCNERTGKCEEVVDDYLEGTELGDYFISAHYGDMALGTFIDYVKNSDYYNNTVFVLYGDHDARIARSEYQYFYNYDLETGKVRDKKDEEYIDFDSVSYELSKKTPLIIWTKNKDVLRKIKYTNNNVLGMYDVLPTLGNMMGFNNPYALGHDIYDIKDNNVVIFPSGNFITNKVYYNNTSGKYRILLDEKSKKNNNITVDISEDYIENLKEYTEKRLTISNNIIVYDLIKKEGENINKEVKTSE